MTDDFEHNTSAVPADVPPPRSVTVSIVEQPDGTWHASDSHGLATDTADTIPAAAFAWSIAAEDMARREILRLAAERDGIA